MAESLPSPETPLKTKPRGRLEGYSGSITTQGVAGPKNLVEYQKLTPGPPIRADLMILQNGNASGGATVYIGPNDQALFPLAPPPAAGVAATPLYMRKVDPRRVAIDDRGSTSTVYFIFGGECTQDAE